MLKGGKERQITYDFYYTEFWETEDCDVRDDGPHWD